MAVVSNFDLRLRPLLEALGLDQLFDALIISAEVRLWTGVWIRLVDCLLTALRCQSHVLLLRLYPFVYVTPDCEGQSTSVSSLCTLEGP